MKPFLPKSRKGETAMDQAKISIQLTAYYRYDEETATFVSFWPQLNIYAQGHTEDEAMEALKSTIMLYLETCLEHERLDDVLMKAGFCKTRPERKAIVSQQPEEYIKIEPVFDTKFALQMEIPLCSGEVLAEANCAGAQRHSAPRV